MQQDKKNYSQNSLLKQLKDYEKHSNIQPEHFKAKKVLDSKRNQRKPNN